MSQWFSMIFACVVPKKTITMKTFFGIFGIFMLTVRLTKGNFSTISDSEIRDIHSFFSSFTDFIRRMQSYPINQNIPNPALGSMELNEYSGFT